MLVSAFVIGVSIVWLIGAVGGRTTNASSLAFTPTPTDQRGGL